MLGDTTPDERRPTNGVETAATTAHIKSEQQSHNQQLDLQQQHHQQFAEQAAQPFGYAQSSATVETQQQLLHLLYYQQSPTDNAGAPPPSASPQFDRSADLQDSKIDIIERFLCNDADAEAEAVGAPAAEDRETDALFNGLDQTSSVSSVSSTSSSVDRKRHSADHQFDICLEDFYPSMKQPSDGDLLAITSPSSDTNHTMMGGGIEEVGSSECVGVFALIAVPCSTTLNRGFCARECVFVTLPHN